MEYQVDFSIYNIEKIQQAITDFQEIAEIEILNNKGILIKGDYSQDESDEIFNEFMNYVLSIIN